MGIIIYGRNAVRATIESNHAKALFTLDRFANDPLVAFAREKSLLVKFVPENELTKMAKNPSHQGFVVISESLSPLTLEALINLSKREKNPVLLLLDGIEDPQNLGAIMRSADAFGAAGIIMKKTGEAPLNGTVAKVSTGAINYVPVALVTNLSMAMKTLKDAGFWVVATDGGAHELYDDVDYDSPIALVVGSEGFGVSRLVLENSDFIVKIPMVGHVNSLNASVAAGILLAAISRLRRH